MCARNNNYSQELNVKIFCDKKPKWYQSGIPCNSVAVKSQYYLCNVTSCQLVTTSSNFSEILAGLQFFIIFFYLFIYLFIFYFLFIFFLGGGGVGRGEGA